MKENKKARRYTAAKKTEIIHYYYKHGMSKTIAKYDVANSTVHKWIRLQTPSKNLRRSMQPKQTTSPELSQLRQENAKLKKLVHVLSDGLLFGK